MLAKTPLIVIVYLLRENRHETNFEVPSISPQGFVDGNVFLFTDQTSPISASVSILAGGPNWGCSCIALNRVSAPGLPGRLGIVWNDMVGEPRRPEDSGMVSLLANGDTNESRRSRSRLVVTTSL